MGTTWWLRTQDDVFGPVTRDELLNWARMGRVQPGQEVSQDGETWQSATSVDFLDMRWSIDIGDGMPRGPFNKQAAQALLKSGRLPPESRLVEISPAVPESSPVAPEPASPSKESPTSQLPTTASQLSTSNEEEVASLKKQIETLETGLRATKENEAAYESKIQLLSDEIRRLPPTAQLAADAQAAVYALMKEEADELSAALDAENKEAEALREYRRKRIDRLLARRQEILKRIGTDAEDMTRRALQAHPEDPRTAHMRQELDALRVLQERSAQEAERKIRDLSAKLRERDAEVKRLREQAADVTLIYRQLQETREKLSAREKELVEERQKAESERQLHATAQQTLLTRLSSLEMGMPGTTQQSREARSVRLAPWMGLKK